MQMAPPVDAPERASFAVVEEAAALLFIPCLDPERSGIVEAVARRAARFATIDDGEIILDKRALLLGMIAVGLKESEALAPMRGYAHPDLPYIMQGDENMIAWFADWLVTTTPDLAAIVEGQDRSAAVLAAFKKRARIDLSWSVKALLSRAQQIAARTVERPLIDVRHLLFALLEQPREEWDFLPARPTIEAAHLTLSGMIGWMEQGGDGNGDAWRAFLPSFEAAAEEEEATANDRYRTQTDDPARVDALERGPFAAVIAARIIEARQTHRGSNPEDDRAFMVHLHGPWGSGKSSMLNLIQQELERKREDEKQSLVVWFNAWKHQRMRPPWWALLVAVYKAALPRLYKIGDEKKRNTEHWALRRLWWGWRLRADWVPILLVAMLLGVLGFAIVSGMPLGAFEVPLKIFAALATAAAGIYTYARLMLFGSSKAAQTYADLTTDPYGPIVELFARMVAKIRLPLVVFIDDLDRCDGDYVVELLEGIQTLFRHAPVTYVVAADRKWICSSFEKKYCDFSTSIGEPCRPLGYLFLDKMFQISAGMPRLSPELQSRYLTGLLGEGEPETTVPDEAAVERATERVQGLTDEAEIQQAIDETRDKSIAEQRAVRAAAALQITSAAATRSIEHRLQKLAHLLERNPRSMKRLVNAVGMAQARGILEGRVATPEARARWAMLSVRWPLLADFIADNPEAISRWTPRNGAAGDEEDEPDPGWPEPVRQLHGNRAVAAVVGGPGEDGRLTPESLAPLLA